MTLKTKNIILNSTTALNMIISLILVSLFTLFPEIRHTNQVILLLNSLFVLIGTLLVYLFFKKSLPSEIILFIIFLTSLSLQGIRVLDFLIEFETFMVTILIGRISIFFKYVGLLSLLGASLFSYSIKKQKVGSWILLSVLGSIIISTIIHFNTGIIENNLLPKIIFNKEELVITMSILVITVSTLIKSGFDAKNRDYLYLGVSTFALSLSLTLTFISLNLLSGIIILLLFIIGSIMFLKSMHNITLWG